MRACATANALAAVALIAIGAVSACSGGSPAPSGPGPTEPPGATASPGIVEPSATTPPAPTSPPAATGESKAPRTAADCKEKLTELTNVPDGGVAMNNAMTAGDAGSSDRMAPIYELIQSKRDAFRCCFDLWSKDHPGQKGHVVLSIELKADGTLTSVKQDQKASNVYTPDMDACLSDVAKGLTYPKSPSGKLTSYNHPFDFKPR